MCSLEHLDTFFSKKNPKQCRMCLAKRRREWGTKNKDKLAAYSKQYNLNNRPLRNSHESQRRARIRKAFASWNTEEELFLISEAFHLAKLRETLTGFKWEVDHIIPLKHPLVCGLHCIENLQVIPRKINGIKGNRYQIR